jgi:23S rRNA (cytosine1962-C5)-methyltransferase
MDLRGYELLASGRGQRLERWCDRVILRPETAAQWSWPREAPLPDWDGLYHGSAASGGDWEWRTPLPDPAVLGHRTLSFVVKPTASKHLGLFPEHAANWDWITRSIRERPTEAPPRILNLFGYTGGATLAAAAAGAAVTHVDASRAMVSWCMENARLSGLGDAPIRYLVDDALTFLSREIRRGNSYEGVIMDPPSYGRGKGGKMWKLADHLPLLLDAVMDVLSDESCFILLNTYTEELDGASGVLLADKIKGLPGAVETISLGLTGSIDGRFLPMGKAHRWTS